MKRSPHSQNKVIEHLPITCSQKWLMDEMAHMKRPGWNTIEMFVKTKLPMNERIMEESISHLLDKYENLRVKIIRKEGKWVQELYDLETANAFDVYDFTNDSREKQMEKIRQICIRTRDWLSPGKGNLFKFLFFKLSKDEGRIWICIHHIISDFTSIVLLSNEFVNAYNNIINQNKLKKLINRDYRKWFYIVEGYTRDVLLPSELEYWISLPWDKAMILPSDFPEKYEEDSVIKKSIENRRLIDSYRSKVYYLDKEDTLALANIYGAEFENILIAVFFLSLADNFGLRCLDLSVCNSGRNILPPDYGIDVNRLLGFIASLRAIMIERPESNNVLLEVENVVEQIKSIPNGGKGFFLVGEHIEEEQLKKSFNEIHFRRKPEVLLNYLGRVDMNISNEQFEIVSSEEEDIGKDMYSPEIRTTLLECTVGVKQSKLFLDLLYIEDYFKSATIDQIADKMISMFKEILVLKGVKEASLSAVPESC